MVRGGGLFAPLPILNRVKKKLINNDYSALTEKIETSHKAPKSKVNNRVRITKYKNIFLKVTPKIGQDKYLLSTLL